jgi:16S rRNA (guanine966-N2)-methyltransferase
MLRIIAGELGGRRLRAPSGQRTRPTAERVREALFSILGPPPPGATALDLYAGSGALGIEALSRGVERAVFVEQDRTVSRVLQGNLHDLGLKRRARVLTRPVLPTLRTPSLLAEEGPFFFIFADPPYKSGELAALLSLVPGGTLLAPDGVLVAECAARDADAIAEAADAAGVSKKDRGHHLPPPLRLCDQRRYGDTSLLFFRSDPADSLPAVSTGEAP